MRQAAPHIHRAVVVDIERGALALERLGGLHVEQIGIGVLLQSAVVGTNEGVVNGTGRDKQTLDGVSGTFHLAEHRLQIGQPLLLALGRQLQGAQAVLLGCRLNTPVYLVAIRAVAQPIRPIYHCDERRRAGLFLVRINLIDRVAFLGTSH